MRVNLLKQEFCVMILAAVFNCRGLKKKKGCRPTKRIKINQRSFMNVNTQTTQRWSNNHLVTYFQIL